MSAPLFIIGAGFNVDANAEAGSVAVPSAYPLVGQLAEICFGLKDLPPGQSIEELFHEAIRSEKLEPTDKLYDMLMQADYFLGDRLSANGSPNSYHAFLQRFPDSHFLSFNYDSLVEILLFAMGRWRPDDGYGAPVQTQLMNEAVSVPTCSRNLVLHLHGTLCVYPSEFSVRWTSSGRSHTGVLEHRDTPLFRFDPNSITHRFFPYERIPPDLSYRQPPQRVIAPIPHKAEGLRGAFVRAVYSRALDLASRADRVVCIGYRFNPYDRMSYDRILRTLMSSNIAVVLVSPDATEVRARLARSYPAISWIALPLTLRRWVSEGFPGAER